MSQNLFTSTPVFRCNATLGNENISPDPENSRNDVNKKLDALMQKVDDQAKSIAALINSQAQNNLLMKQVLSKVEKNIRFPVCDIMHLTEIEDDISKNKDTYVSVLKNIIGPIGVTNGMKKIISDNVVAQINYDGLQEKVAFKKFECLNNAIYEAVQVDGYTKGDYEREVKRAFRLSKNRYHKAGSLKKQKDNKI